MSLNTMNLTDLSRMTKTLAELESLCPTVTISNRLHVTHRVTKEVIGYIDGTEDGWVFIPAEEGP